MVQDATRRTPRSSLLTPQLPPLLWNYFLRRRYRVGATWSSWTGVVANLSYGLVAHFAFDEVSGDRSDNVGGYALRGFDCTINSAPGLFVRGALFNRSGFLQGIDETTLFSPSPSGLTVRLGEFGWHLRYGSDVRFVSLWNDSGWPANSSWAIWSGTPEEANITAMVMGTGYTTFKAKRISAVGIISASCMSRFKASGRCISTERWCRRPILVMRPCRENLA